MPNFTIQVEIKGKVENFEVEANNKEEAEKIAKQKIREFIVKQYGKDLKRRPPFAK